MRSKGFLHAAALLALAAISPLLLAAQAPTRQIPILEGERWWAGVISQSHLMPFTAASQYEFDFLNDTAGNQAQPLLISDKGRYVWSENAFRFRFSKGVLQVWARARELQLGSSQSSLRDAYRHVSRTFFPPSGKTPHPTLFTHPQFNTWIEMTYNQNQKDILQYARTVIDQGFSPGVLMIDEGWFRTYGDWDFDCARFGDPKAMMDELHRIGFKVMLWVCPYITPAGTFFTNLRLDSTEKKKTVWIQNAKNPAAPAIMEWWDGFSAVVDLTSPEGTRWFKGQLDRLVNTYGVDGFKFDGGDAEYCSPKAMLTPTLSFQPQTTPNQHSEAFARLGLEYPMNEFRACWKMGGQAIAQRLRDKEHNWTDLVKLVPGILNQGLMGYPFNCPDLIGGGEFLSFRNLENVDQELIVRAAQCHALMPMMQFSVAPWRVLSREKLEICLKMAGLHTKMGEEILALAKEAAQTGEPIVRALEYEYPGKGYGGITDQFLLGQSILVAPVLQRGAVERTIQFPPGTWKGEDGSVVKGPCQIEVPAPLSRLPWYRKVAATSGL
jgi:alpha-glucosidase